MLQRLWRKFKYYGLRLLRSSNGDHVVAIGFAIGFFPCWYPTFGVGLVLSLALSRLVRGNIPAAVMAASLGSVIWPVLFYLNYKIGFLINDFTSSPASFELDEAIAEPVPETDDYAEVADHYGILGDIGLHFLVGSVANSIIFTVVFYFGLRLLLKRYRARLLRRVRQSLRRSPLSARTDKPFRTPGNDR